MAHFLKHEPCPKCGSRDNVARYSDGSAWCFGCGYKERATKFVPYEVKKKVTLPDITKTLPQKNLDWLQQWLTPQECQMFWYSPKMDRHLYIIGDVANPLYFEARSIDKQPKTLSYGQKPLHILNANSDKLVYVEDIISAIVVSRHYAACPLFGSYLPKDWAIHGKRYRQFIWLDYDKYRESVKRSKDLYSMGCNIKVVCSRDDPKYQSSTEILAKIN